MSGAEDRPRSRGLGRGLSALLGEGEEAEALRSDAPDAPARTGTGGARTLPVAVLSPNPDQPRKRFDEAELDALAQSISGQGLLQPILVRPLPGDPERYQIVAGERRWRAAQRAGLHDVPVVIRELTDRETMEIAIVENVQRADLNPVEEARALSQLVERFGHTQEDVAKAIGKSRAHVANMLRLLALPSGVLSMLESGALTAGHARAVAASDDPEALARQIVDGGLSVRAAEQLARQAAGKTGAGRSAPERKSQQSDPDTRALEADLSERLGLSVAIRHDGESGEVRISFSSLEQLDEVCRRLTSSAMSGAY
ncbi:ParB/RepB/Spo0J family partition protein [Alkalicaulis satelles]|uniref:ParB/RepB/Spo0J family partition protein n=1 Tax=Alkalicaulis satelles TaxID=2609175 RepID=A0A5M6ZJB0_9PROT|nr:ParB/RepB/Spo0J family partition protein [Alkalicaulis satelles]KAA5803834.1 ParB/RepB/Spo0J family partition protein [Alkalicaulis satelles]